jgi:hypothetical protein
VFGGARLRRRRAAAGDPAVEVLGRRVDARRVAAAGEVAERSRPELGTGQLPAKKGCRDAGELLERVTLVSGHTARRRMRLGKQLRTGFSPGGEPLPPTFPATAVGLATGAIGVDTADAILTALTPTLRCTNLDSVQAAESELVAAATGTSSETPVPASADEIRLHRTPDQRRHDVLAVILDIASRAGEAPTIGGAPATVLVSVREQDLNADFGQGRGVGWIDGIEAPISISAVTDLISNGGQQKVVINNEGRIIALDSPERCFTAAQHRAIQLRDGTCIIPGCRIPAGMTEIHHVIPDAAGGPTHTDNGVCLCWWHHRYLAASGWAIRMLRGAVQIMAPPWLETGTRKWRNVTTARTRTTDAIERKNMTRDDN